MEVALTLARRHGSSPTRPSPLRVFVTNKRVHLRSSRRRGRSLDTDSFVLRLLYEVMIHVTEYVDFRYPLAFLPELLVVAFCSLISSRYDWVTL
jgi:hypothetical protein